MPLHCSDMPSGRTNQKVRSADIPAMPAPRAARAGGKAAGKAGEPGGHPGSPVQAGKRAAAGKTGQAPGAAPGAVPTAAPTAEDSTGRTLRRGLAVLDAVLDGGPDGLRLTDLCHATGLQRPTVCRLLEPLLAAGHVRRRDRFRYVPGGRFAGLAQAAARPNLAVRLQPVLASISAACGDAAFAIVREGSQSLCIARQIGTHPVQALAIQVGTLQPLGVGAAGLALLAALPDDEVAAVIADNAPLLGRYGGMTPERLRLLVRTTRERGWSLIGNHATQNVLAVSCAVPDAGGRPMAAISVASTVDRMTRERQRSVARTIEQALEPLHPMQQGKAPARKKA
jgi:DNA-binding IclR family transcriptional regulator